MTAFHVKCRDLDKYIGCFIPIPGNRYKLLKVTSEFGKLKVQYEDGSGRLYSECLRDPDMDILIYPAPVDVLAMEKNIVPSAVAVALVGLPAVQRALKVWQNIAHFKIPDAMGDAWSLYEFSMMEFALALSEGQFDYGKALRVFQQLKDHKLIHPDGTVNRIVKDFL